MSRWALILVIASGCSELLGFTDVKRNDGGTEIDGSPSQLDDAGKPAFTALSYDTATVLVPSGMPTVVAFSNQLFDDRAEYTAGTGTFEASHAGDYQVCAALNGPVAFELDLEVNGVREKTFANAPLVAGTSVANGCRVVRLTAAGTVRVLVAQQSGSAMSFGGNSTKDWLTIEEQTAQVEVESNTAFTATSSTFTRIPYATTATYNDGEYAAATQQFTPTVDGDYELCAAFAGNGTTLFELDLFELGAFGGTDRITPAFVITRSGASCKTFRLENGRPYDVELYQQSGADVSFPVNAGANWLSIRKVPQTEHVVMNTADTFSIPGSTYVTVPFTGVSFPDDTRYNPSTFLFTSNGTRDYEVCASIFDGDDASRSELYLYIDGAIDHLLGGPNASDTTMAISLVRGCRVVRVAQGKTIELRVFSPTARTFEFNGVFSFLQLRAIR